MYLSNKIIYTAIQLLIYYTAVHTVVNSVSVFIYPMKSITSITEDSYRPLHQCGTCCAASTDETSALCRTLCLVPSHHLQHLPKKTLSL